VFIDITSSAYSHICLHYRLIVYAHCLFLRNVLNNYVRLLTVGLQSNMLNQVGLQIINNFLNKLIVSPLLSAYQAVHGKSVADHFNPHVDVGLRHIAYRD